MAGRSGAGAFEVFVRRRRLGGRSGGGQCRAAGADGGGEEDRHGDEGQDDGHRGAQAVVVAEDGQEFTL